MKSEYEVLITGGREYNNRENLFKRLDKLLDKFGESLVIVHGSAKGADLLAEEWAKKRQVKYRGHPAKWDRYEKTAGKVRNAEMIHDNNIHVCLAFPGGRGTADMVQRAEAADIQVITFND